MHGVTHFAVTNMPGAVPQTSSLAICAAILPYVQRLAAGVEWRQHEPLRKGINVEPARSCIRRCRHGLRHRALRCCSLRWG
ncbi:Alanine dehydrogenase [mine drainage metagenome]|uniref:Alanine dehydrogenase n=1 Tax=mine drainage metagenome TaxID=410659 RepID=T1B313_9ZZZZ